jgi:hypothetical protein
MARGACIIALSEVTPPRKAIFAPESQTLVDAGREYAVQFLPMPAASLRALLTRSIDYAGLFPPAELGLEAALENHATYVRSPDLWMLGTFVLPLGKFAAARGLLSQFEPEHPLKVSALAPRSANAAEFRGALESVVKSIAELRVIPAGVVSVEQVEIPLPLAPIDDLLGAVNDILGDLTAKTFLEAPADDAPRMIAALAGSAVGFKLRTGGVTANAFPTGRQIATALVAAAHYRVPIKFTAGLHHPVRLFHPSVETRMHGFLNVLGAGVLSAEHGWNEPQTEEMLADEQANSFSFDDQLFRWRDWKITTAQIDERRRLVTSLGSCSFDEPRDDLRQLGIL